MSAFTWFLIGFLSASALFLAAALSYYLRARKRVQAIESAIHRYQQASRVVGDAAQKVYESPIIKMPNHDCCEKKLQSVEPYSNP